jgi:MFS family permease
MIGPAISGLILHTVGWRAVFLLVPALALPAWLVMWPVARRAPAPGGPESSQRATGPQARRLVLLATAAGTGAALLEVAGSRSQPGWRMAAVAALIVVLWSARRLLPGGIFRLRRGVPAVVGVRGLVGATFTAAEAYLPLLLVREHRWDPAAAGAVLTLAAGMWSIGAWIQGRYPLPQTRHVLSRFGTALLATGTTTVFAAALPGVPVWVAPAGWAVAGTGMGLVYSSTSLLALHLSPPERHGEASSALTMSDALSAAVALAVAGTLFAMFLPANLAAGAPVGAAPFLAGISVAVLTAALSVIGAWRTVPVRHRAEERENA